jgi:hypothetical protein
LVPEYFFSDQQFAPEGVKLLNGFANFKSLGAARDAAEAGTPLTWSRKAYSPEKHEKTFSLLRLHGCVAWYYQKNPAREPISNGKPTAKQVPTNPVELDLRSPRDIRDYFDRLCLLYPGRNQYLGRDPHAFGFERLYDACTNCNSILFIGFSFRDIDVAAAIFNAVRQRNKISLKNADPVRVVIVDPYIDSDQFNFRLHRLQKDIAIPIEFENLDITAIRAKFPPGDDKQIEVILNALKGRVSP